MKKYRKEDKNNVKKHHIDYFYHIFKINYQLENKVMLCFYN